MYNDLVSFENYRKIVEGRIRKYKYDKQLEKKVIFKKRINNYMGIDKNVGKALKLNSDQVIYIEPTKFKEKDYEQLYKASALIKVMSNKSKNEEVWKEVNSNINLVENVKKMIEITNNKGLSQECELIKKLEEIKEEKYKVSANSESYSSECDTSSEKEFVRNIYSDRCGNEYEFEQNEINRNIYPFNYYNKGNEMMSRKLNSDIKFAIGRKDLI